MDEPIPSREDGLVAFGRYLVRERELRGLSLEDVARATRLTASSLESIESGDPVRAPHRAYVVVYLRGYAAAVGLDPDEVVLRYEEALGPPAAAAPARAGRRTLAAALLLGLAAVAAALAGWWLRRG